MSKFFAVPGENGLSDLSSSDEESLYGSSSDLDSQSDVSEDMSSSDDSGSDNDDDDESEPEDGDQPRNQYLRNQFLKGQSDSDSDSDEERGTVKSAKEKLLDEITSDSSSLEQNIGKEEWINVLTIFDRLVKVADRVFKQYTLVPTEFSGALHTLEEALQGKSGKKLSSSMSKAQNTLRQRMKKTKKEVDEREALLAKAEAARQASKTASPGPVSTPQAAAVPASGGVAGATSGITKSTVFQTLQSVIESRGRKNADRNEQVSVLEQQLAVAQTTYEKISLLLMLIPLRFDLLSTASAGSSYGGADFAPWQQIEQDIRMMFEVLEAQSEYIVLESAPEPEDLEQGPAVGAGNKRAIPGSLPTLVERLDDEHARILATYDPHTTEYLERLRDETRLAELILRAQCHQEQNLKDIGKPELQSNESFCRLVARRIDHIYYKPAKAVEITEKAAWERVPAQLATSVGPRPQEGAKINTLALISNLCQLEYQQSNPVLRARAVLSLIYQYALANDYYKARDLMLMSHLQSQIHSAEPATQVLFNRALVQVGLCAFRNGLVADALQSLQEICGGSRLKELLGQGAARMDAQQQQDESQPGLNEGNLEVPEILPYHMHINLELIECVYLTASMLQEVPYLATLSNSRAAQQELKKRAQNRPFRRLLDAHDRQVFNGPSETTRDYVIQAAKRLQSGDWRKALSLLSSIKVWNLLSPNADAKQSILTILSSKLKVEALRTYLLTYGSVAYHSIALEFLHTEFELPLSEINQLVVKMIIGDEVSALLDPTSSFLVFKPEADVSRLQTLALALADKAAQLAERNERLAADGHNPEQKRPIRGRA